MLATIIHEISSVLDERELLLRIYRTVEVHLVPFEAEILAKAIETRRDNLTARYYDLLLLKNDLEKDLKNNSPELQKS